MTVCDNIQITLQASSALPKYQVLADALADWLTQHQPSPGTRLPSERLLAENCGTTPVTVAKSLNELVRKGILERRPGSGTYVTDHSLTKGLLRIGIVAHEPIHADDCYISEVLSALHAYWCKRGADIITLVRTPENYETAIREYNLAGLVVLAPQDSFVAPIRRIIQRNVPLVTVGICFEGMENHSFGTDHRQVCAQAIAYLHRLGHHRIGLVNTYPAASSSAEREAGYCRGMWNAKLPVNPDWVIRGSLMHDPVSRDHLKTLLSGQDAPSAIVLAGHSDIRPFYELTHELHLKIPDDVSVLAFDDPAYAVQLMPPLTVFAQPIEAFSLRAAHQLERLIQHEPADPVYPDAAILIERGSCCRAES